LSGLVLCGTANRDNCRDLYNRQLHQSEYDLAKKEAKLVARQLGISVDEAEGQIVAELQRNVDGQTAQADGGVHDYQVRSILGCQMLECNASSTDPNYWNHNYNSQYIAPNQQAYDLGIGQSHTGQTYNQLVTSNVKNNPVSTAIAGAGMIGLGIATAGGVPSLIGMATGGGIGAAVNTGAQYAFNNGQINPVDTAMAGVTGALTFGTGFIPGLLINTGGSLAGSAYKGESPNAGMAGAAAGSLAGYVVGGKLDGWLGNKLDPWYKPEWSNLGLGISRPVSSCVLPSLLGTTMGAAGSETTSGFTGILLNPTPSKK